MFIAVVCSDLNSEEHAVTARRSCITGTNRDKVIQEALALRRSWEARGNGPYRIFAGVLVAEIVTPQQFEEIPIV